MSLLILGNKKSTTTYLLKNIKKVILSKTEINDEDFHVEVKIVIDGSSYEQVIYNERGDESVVDAGEEVYRNVLNGLEAGTPVNLTEFSLTAPKKKAPAKKPEPETEPESEAPPEQPAE